MGGITNLLKTGATNSFNTLKNHNITGKINSAMNMAGIDIPKVEMPEATKEWKLDIDPTVIKPPAGMTDYFSPIAKKLTSLTGFKLPSEIGGVPLPTLPDLSSVSSKVDEYLSSFGLDTKKLGLGSVDDILKEPDLKSIAKVPTYGGVDMNNLPDVNSAMDGINFDSVQKEIDEMTGSIPGAEKIDISKYF